MDVLFHQNPLRLDVFFGPAIFQVLVWVLISPHYSFHILGCSIGLLYIRAYEAQGIGQMSPDLLLAGGVWHKTRCHADQSENFNFGTRCIHAIAFILKCSYIYRTMYDRNIYNAYNILRKSIVQLASACGRLVLTT